MPKTSELTDTTRIVVSGVDKRFHLRHTHSLKETFIALIKRKKVSETFDALHGVDFQIREGESVALLGFNGSGKSTLLKLISGVLVPDAGQVLTRGRVAGLIEVGAGFHPDLSGRENVYLNAAILGMSKDEVDEKFDEIVAFSEIEQFIDTEVKHYSSGMFVRLAFAVAIHTKLDIMLVDEVLSVGDEPFQRKCLAKIRELQEQGKTMVVVSHDLDTVAELCQRGILLRKGQIVFDGDSKEAVRMLRENRATAFSDVRESDPDHDSIRWASEVGISRGYPDGSYRPDEVVSRQAAAAFLYRAFSTAGSSAPEADPAGDVPASHPFSREIGWYLTSRGLRGCERFEPEGPFLESDLRDALVALGHPAPESAFSSAEVPVTRRQIARVLHLLRTPTTLA